MIQKMLSREESERQADLSPDKLIDTLKRIAKSYAEYDYIKEKENNNFNGRTFEAEKVNWNEISLSHGLPGICLLFGTMMNLFPNEECWPEYAHEYIGRTVKHINEKGISDLSMFSGLTGIGLSIASCSRNFNDYKKLTSSINLLLIDQIDRYYNTMRSEKYTNSFLFDVISGISGILGYLFMFKNDDLCKAKIDEGLDILVDLVNKEVDFEGNMVPGWYIPAKYQFTESEKAFYKKGNFNTGLSHGVAGILAVLSMAYLENIVRPGQKDAINKIIEFFDKTSLSYNGRTVWECQIRLEDYLKKSNNEDIYVRDAWCYGVPGISYSMILAANAINDRRLLLNTIDNMKKSLNDIQNIHTPSLCHGYSGLYEMINILESRFDINSFNVEKNNIKEKIKLFYNTNIKNDFCNIEYNHRKKSMEGFHSAGFLEGNTGIILSILDGEIQNKNNIWTRAMYLV